MGSSHGVAQERLTSVCAAATLARESEMSDRFILKWVVKDDPLSKPYSTQHDALQKARELFDEHGPDLEIELHLNRLSPPPSILFNTQWMRNWNRRGRPSVQE